MALTTIKTGGLADNSVTDAKVANAITITGAQTGITQVGTLTAGVWNSSTKIASAYLDDDTAHLSEAQTFSGAKTFSANAVFNGEVLVNNTSSGNAKLYIKGGGTSTANSLYITDSAGADILYVKDNKSAKFYGTLETVGNVGIGASASFKFDTQDNSSTWAGRILNTNAGGQGLLVRTDATNGATALGVYANGAYRLTVTDSSSTFAGQILGSASGVAYSFTGDPDTGVQSGGTNTLQITTAGAKAVDFDANQLATFAGDVVINGNSTNYDQLKIKGGGSESGIKFIDSADNTDGFIYATGGKIGFLSSGGAWRIQTLSTGSTISGNINMDGWSTKSIAFGSANSSFSATNTGARIEALVHATGGAAHGSFKVYVNSGDSITNALEIGEGGLTTTRVNFNSGSNAYCFQVKTADANEFIVNGDDRYYLFNTWQTSWSDRKLKKNITSITNGLDICDKLNPVTFNWKKEWAEGDAGLSNRKFYGIIAQELQEVLPELVYEGKDKLMVQRDELQWILLSAIKELSTKVTSLENA